MLSVMLSEQITRNNCPTLLFDCCYCVPVGDQRCMSIVLCINNIQGSREIRQCYHLTKTQGCSSHYSVFVSWISSSLIMCQSVFFNLCPSNLKCYCVLPLALFFWLSKQSLTCQKGQCPFILLCATVIGGDDSLIEQYKREFCAYDIKKKILLHVCTIPWYVYMNYRQTRPLCVNQIDLWQAQ